MMFDEVRRLELFDGLSDEMLRSLVDASDEVAFEVGDILWIEGQPAAFWWVLLEGRLEMVRHVGRESAVMGTFDRPGQWGEGWTAFDPAGVYLITGRPITAGRVLRVPVAALRAVVDGVPVVRHLVDGLFQTARHIENATRQREALVALGTLSAGLAHELNNPAAAAIRAVGTLESTMRDIRSAAGDLAARGLGHDQYAALEALLAEAAPHPVGTDALAAADREDALSDWLAGHGVARDWLLAPALAAASLGPGWCDRVLEVTGADALQPALEWLAATVTSQAMLGEVRESTQRVSDLVDSVKSYSQMDRGSLQCRDVTEGLESTLVMLGHRIGPGIEVVRCYGDDVPPVDAYAAELNQVWTSLIDNALDAMGDAGVLTLTTAVHGDEVTVTVADDGVGMPPEVLERAFDTFFTTKEVGRGTGLGLSTARRTVVERHGGHIAIESAPGRTVVRVGLPVHQRRSAAPGGPAVPDDGEG